jgi:hypothetical protein
MNLINKYLGEGSKRTIGKKNGYEVVSSQSDKEGSYIEVLYKGKKIASGDFDRGADTFFIKIGKKDHFNTVDDILKAAMSK